MPAVPTASMKLCFLNVVMRAVFHNQTAAMPALLILAIGRTTTFAELRSQFALDVVPTKSYAANSAWQQLNVLAHNLCRSFQLDTIAETKSISRKRTPICCTHSHHPLPRHSNPATQMAILALLTNLRMVFLHARISRDLS